MNTLLYGYINGLADNHAHLFMLNDARAATQRFVKHKGKYILEVVVHPDYLARSLKIKEDFNNIVHIAFGIHPEYLKPKYALVQEERNRVYKDTQSAIVAFEQVFDSYADSIKVIGEVGLDIYRVETLDAQTLLAKQEQLLVYYIGLCKSRNLPLMLHLRGKNNNDYSVYHRAIEILKENGIVSQDDLKVYFHSFVADLDVAKKVINNGFFIGVNGIATYKSASHLKEVIKFVPEDLILIETDSPFLKPSNVSKNCCIKNNEPVAVKYIQEFVNRIKAGG